jgi:PadR family transcriptional regulator PadR
MSSITKQAQQWAGLLRETVPRSVPTCGHRLVDKGRKQLLGERSQSKRMTEAVARVIWPAATED